MMVKMTTKALKISVSSQTYKLYFIILEVLLVQLFNFSNLKLATGLVLTKDSACRVDKVVIQFMTSRQSMHVTHSCEFLARQKLY